MKTSWLLSEVRAGDLYVTSDKMIFVLSIRSTTVKWIRFFENSGIEFSEINCGDAIYFTSSELRIRNDNS